jgi:hypothetical protein
MDKNRLIAVRVGFWAESDKSFCLLVDEAPIQGGGFMRSEWFPKKLCKVRWMGSLQKGYTKLLICPLWLLEKNKVEIKHKLFVE